MPISPVLERQTTYPFVRLHEAARRVEARGIEVIDFGMGDPREATDPLIRDALVAGLRERMGYPLAQGLPELREAISAWARRRFDVDLDPDTQIIPTLGSKEAIFSFAQVVVEIRRPSSPCASCTSTIRRKGRAFTRCAVSASILRPASSSRSWAPAARASAR